MSIRKILSILFCLFALTACGPKTLTLSAFDGSKSVKMTVEIADSPEERERGLMNRPRLETDHGMLFVFPVPAIQTFWMKNTLIPLEILFFDANGEFVNAATMAPCKADPCDTYTSLALAQYALEVPPDFRVSHGVGVGWKMDLKKVRGMAKAK